MRNTLNQQGAVLPTIISTILAIGFAAFGGWSYFNYVDAKNNTEQKIAQAVANAESALEQKLDDEYKEREKKPYETFLSNSQSSSIEFKFPRTWSVYSIDNRSSARPLDATFHPNVVYADDTLYALRIVVDESNYERTLEQYEPDIRDRLVTAKPIVIAGVKGIRIDGQIDRYYKGAIVLFAVRDKVIRIWTESERFIDDFDQIMKDLTFVP